MPPYDFHSTRRPGARDLCICVSLPKTTVITSVLCPMVHANSCSLLHNVMQFHPMVWLLNFTSEAGAYLSDETKNGQIIEN